jgi:hypothetical protein
MLDRKPPPVGTGSGNILMLELSQHIDATPGLQLRGRADQKLLRRRIDAAADRCDGSGQLRSLLAPRLAALASWAVVQAALRTARRCTLGFRAGVLLWGLAPIPVDVCTRRGMRSDFLDWSRRSVQ